MVQGCYVLYLNMRIVEKECIQSPPSSKSVSLALPQRPLLLRPPRQGEPSGLMFHQQPLLTLEAGFLWAVCCIGLMSFHFGVQERSGHPDTCHSTLCPIKIDNGILFPPTTSFELEVVRETEARYL